MKFTTEKTVSTRDGRVREVHAGLFLMVPLSDDPVEECKLNATHPTRRLRLNDFLR